MPTTRTRSGASAPAFALAALACGCATASLPPPAATRERARAAASYSAALRVSLKGPGVRVRTRALVAFERPDALRVEIPGPTGARLVAVTRDGELAAVFPGERAVYRGAATAADLEALLGVPLTPGEVMDLLVGAPSPRLRAYRAWWGPSLPRQIDATLPDGGRLKVSVEDAEAGVALRPEAFVAPAHDGYRVVGADEARGLWGGRESR
jgi:hypothetical protein